MKISSLNFACVPKATRTRFQLEIITMNMFSGIVYFREIIFESSRNVSETTPRLQSKPSLSLKCRHWFLTLNRRQIRVSWGITNGCFLPIVPFCWRFRCRLHLLLSNVNNHQQKFHLHHEQFFGASLKISQLVQRRKVEDCEWRSVCFGRIFFGSEKTWNRS